MIKKTIIFLIFLTLCMPAQAQSYSAIDKMENTMFGMTYENENDKSRIERLEKNIYGEIKQGNINTRINNLSKDLHTDILEEETKPSLYTEFENTEEEIADSSVDYPLINDFEKKIFKKEFKNQDLKQRLLQLEQNVFNTTFPQDDLHTRTNRLKAAIQIEEKPIETQYYNESLSQITPQEFSNTPEKYDANVTKVLKTLEKKVLKKTYTNQDEETRLERLEEHIFNTSFPQDSIESRLQRLAFAYQATKSSQKYDTNKFSQHMSTAVQVGAFLLMILAMIL